MSLPYAAVRYRPVNGGHNRASITSPASALPLAHASRWHRGQVVRHPGKGRRGKHGSRIIVLSGQQQRDQREWAEDGPHDFPEDEVRRLAASDVHAKKDATGWEDYQRRTEFHTSLVRMRHQNLTAIPSRAKAMTVARRNVPATPWLTGNAPKRQSRRAVPIRLHRLALHHP